MASKGIAWIPVAIGIIFLAEILIFSLSFNKVSIFSREALDANVVFEGDELETYVKSIDSSVELSMAKAIDKFDSDYSRLLRYYDVNGFPSSEGVRSEVAQSANGFALDFLKAHQDFSDNNKRKIEITTPNACSFVWQDKTTSLKLSPDVQLDKVLSFASFTRKFVAEATLDTVFKEIIDSMENFIGNDMLGKAAFSGVSKSGPSGTQSCDPTDPTSFLNLPSYLDNDAACNAGPTPGCVGCIGGNQNGVCGKNGGKSDYKVYGTGSVGLVDFCTETKIFNICDSEDPSDPRFPSSGGKVSKEPLDGTVYTMTHNSNTFGDIVPKVKQRTLDHSACLIDVLDQQSTDYTVSADGSLRTGANYDEVGSVKKIGLCICENVGDCPDNGITDQPKDKRWTCHELDRKTVDTNYYFAASGTIRYQEDGFQYAFSPTPSSFKIKFRAISGNRALTDFTDTPPAPPQDLKNVCTAK